MMLFLGAVRLAFSALRRNSLRSMLTVLGILIGVAAVVIVVALAGGASEAVGGQIDAFAANAIFINPQPTQQSGVRNKGAGRLTENDAKAIAREAVSVSGVAPFLSTVGQVVYGDKNVATGLYGVTLPYFPIRKFNVEKGAFWTEGDELLKTKVCLVGPTVAHNLFGTEDPIGRTIRIGRAPFRIIGVLAPKGTSPFGEDQDDRIFMPIGTYRSRVVKTAPGRVDMLIAASTTSENTQRAQDQITSILRQRHHIPPGAEPDFNLSTQAEFRETQQSISKVLTLLLLGVAAVSLIVGGIGVMNVMLVSVAERTREIGIRMAIGARERDIMLQFLIEAVVLSLVGGTLGILFGVGITLVLGRVLEWNTIPSSTAVLIAVSTSAFIGLFFGYLPARRAAKLDPIVALRVE